ncbi:hypothetical protein OU995_11935 [Roseateles sp. SL47]|uniref:hypothetical protein n=1 Tax=Roseateles sp. SL47 TaxID=2995138 RepID=UPI002271CD87|nr:hypothetical protein [Roseateles sp. SL47]WAC75359.1 hypothetical protein OU995_11935 [Roseateles sp. SL47]
MKVHITHLKAPWPSGASVGSVVEFQAEQVPGWAVGKCVPVGDEEEAAHTVAAPSEITVSLSLDSAEVQEAFQSLRKEAVRRIEEAEQSFEIQRQELLAENAGLREQLAEKDQLILELQTKPQGSVGSEIDQQAAAERAALEADAAQAAKGSKGKAKQ